MGDIIDQAQENDELFRKVSLQKHFPDVHIPFPGARNLSPL